MSALASARRKRSPSIVFGCMSVGILVLMMAALNQAQPPPPPTAEYAPEAIQALKNAPLEQTSRFGKGPLGSNGLPGASPSPSVSPGGGIPEDRIHQCVGGRQIEDTQSPPCVPGWDPKRDNGGHTWMGVTRDEIRVAVPAWENEQLFRLYVKFFNKRFEFYGRQIVPIDITGCSGFKPQDMQKCAESAKALNVFASTSFSDVGGNQQYYYDALAKYGILSVSSHPDRRTEQHLAAHAPFEWSYLPSFDKAGAQLASYVCRQLVYPGAKAIHGGPDVITKSRKIGLVYNNLPDSPAMDVSAFTSGLRSCGVDPEVAKVKYVGDGTTQYTDDESAREAGTAVANFHVDNVTTIVCICHSSTTRQLMVAADGQGYEPEWVISSYAYHTSNGFMSKQVPPSQAAHAFGIDFWNKVVRPEVEPWYRASQQVDDTYAYSGSNFTYYAALWTYHQLLLLASGIQMAGPNLTPSTFQEGLWNAHFPNPRSPYFEGAVGFEDHDHTMVDDAAIIWWDAGGTDPWFGTPGAFCYVRNGARNSIGGYPRQDETFRGSRGNGICDRGLGEQ